MYTTSKKGNTNAKCLPAKSKFTMIMYAGRQAETILLFIVNFDF